MWVKMTDTLGTPGGVYFRGKVYEVADALGTSWVRARLAAKSTMPPEHIAEIFARLDDGAGRPCLFLPPAGVEFGHEIMTPMRLVHFHKASRKVVCCRPGTEVLYPSADVHVTDWTDPVPDRARIGTNRDALPILWPELVGRFPGFHPVSVSGFTMTQELYPIHPGVKIPLSPKRRGLTADVALGVRVRELSPERNWPRERWQRVADAIESAGYTFAVIGRRDTSFDLIGQEFHTGDFDDTDAAVELLQGCRLFLGSDSGAAHLASTVACPMLVFRHHEGRTFVERMDAVNRGRVAFMPDAWNDPAAIAARAIAALRKESHGPQRAA